MGNTTDFIGHIDIEPALNQDEVEYLSAFGLSRRFDRPGGPYDVPSNPMAVVESEREEVDRETYNAVAPGQPGLYCQWVPCWDGCCLSFDGNEKFYQPVEWMRYLIAHFLKSGAKAERSGRAEFEHFTFDHRLDGIVVGCRRDDKELFAIEVRTNRVTTKILRAGLPEYFGREPLPYEDSIDRWQDPRRRRRVPVAELERQPGPEPAPGVVDLAARRARM